MFNHILGPTRISYIIIWLNSRCLKKSKRFLMLTSYQTLEHLRFKAGTVKLIICRPHYGLNTIQVRSWTIRQWRAKGILICSLLILSRILYGDSTNLIDRKALILLRNIYSSSISSFKLDFQLSAPSPYPRIRVSGVSLWIFNRLFIPPLFDWRLVLIQFGQVAIFHYFV